VIAGGVLEFDSTFTQNVGFTGASGTLVLALSQDYTGTVSGFSTSGGTSLDLRDIAFVSVGEASFSAGVLTVSDGTHAAHIKLVGDFSGSTFTASSDGHGGTLVTDPAVSQLVQAMAALGGAAAAHLTPTQDAMRTASPTAPSLASPA
jgi:hypothetical protein